MKVYVNSNGQDFGPYTIQELRDQVEMGNFGPNDLACFDGQNWLEIKKIPGFDEMLPPDPKVEDEIYGIPSHQKGGVASTNVSTREKVIFRISVVSVAALLLLALLIWQTEWGGISAADPKSHDDQYAKSEGNGEPEASGDGASGVNDSRGIGQSNVNGNQDEPNDSGSENPNESSPDTNKSEVSSQETPTSSDPPNPTEPTELKPEEKIQFRKKMTPRQGSPQSPNSTEVDRRTMEAGAKQGHITFSLIWNNLNDLDLHCIGPDGEHISYRHKKGKYGELDVDMNAGTGESRTPVENLYYSKPPKGKYKVSVHHYSNHGDPDPTEFLVRVREEGKPDLEFKGQLSSGNPRRLIYVLEITKNVE
jgi:hypothetical protein